MAELDGACERAMDRFIHFIIAKRKAVVAFFLLTAVGCAALIPFVKVNYDMADYLPPSAQSTKAVSYTHLTLPTT